MLGGGGYNLYQDDRGEGAGESSWPWGLAVGVLGMRDWIENNSRLYWELETDWLAVQVGG